MKILGIGAHLPGQEHLSETFDHRLGLPEGTVKGQTGVSRRYYLAEDESQITMGVAAAGEALADAGVTASEIDLIIGASAVPYQPIPATAPLYQRALGIADGHAYAFDVNSTCLSFLSALQVCEAFFASGQYRRALIISSEVASRALPWASKPDVAGLFGDGAGAIVVEPGSPSLVSLFKTFPSAFNSCGIGSGGTRFDFQSEPEAFAAHSLFDMDGRDLFRLTSKHFSGFVDELLSMAGWDRSQIAHVVPHQASPMALAHMIRHCQFSPEIVVDITRECGNQIAASIPFALNTVKTKFRRGDRLLMLGTSAGVSFGGVGLVY